MALVLLVFFLEHLGLPHFRWTMESPRSGRGQTVYWSVTGATSTVRSPYASARPLFLLLPMDPAPSDYIRDAAQALASATREALKPEAI